MLEDLMQNMFLNAKNQVEQEKKVLADKIIYFESNDKKIILKISADGKLKDLKLSSELLNEDVEMLEDLLIVNINKALQKAEEIRIAEMNKLKGEIIPDLGDIMSSIGDMNLDENEIND